MPTLDFPRTPEQVSDAWLAQILDRGGVLGRGRLVSHERQPVGEPGQTGEVVKLVLHCENAPAAPKSVVAKFAAQYPQARAQMHALGLYEREVCFYRDFAPDAGISVPRSYFADIDLSTGDFALVLEDMSACRVGDYWRPCVPDVEVALDHLAGLHARWWDSPRLRELPWLRQLDDRDYFSGALGPTLQALFPVFEQRFGERVPPYLLELTGAMLASWERFWPARPGDIPTLMHADFHPKQLFFPTQAGGRFAVFDWQSVMVGIGANDVQRILLCGLAPAELREHGLRLIARYRDRLAGHGVQCSTETLVEQVRRCMPWTLYITIFALSTTDPSILERAAKDRGVDYLARAFDDLSESLQHFRVHELI